MKNTLKGKMGLEKTVGNAQVAGGGILLLMSRGRILSQKKELVRLVRVSI